MDQTPLMQESKGRRHPLADAQAIRQWQALVFGHLVRQGARSVIFERGVGAGDSVIRQLHHAVEITCRFISTHLEYVHQAIMQSRDGLKLLDAAKFPLKRAFVPES